MTENKSVVIWGCSWRRGLEYKGIWTSFVCDWYVHFLDRCVVASWPAYRFLKRQIRCSGMPISFWIFPSLLWSTHSKALVEICFSGISPVFSVIQQMLATWSLVPLPFLNPAYISRSSLFMYSWSLAWRILSITLPTHEMINLVNPWPPILVIYLDTLLRQLII